MATFYSISCPECHGKMFVEHVICGKCNGDGRILIPEYPAKPIALVNVSPRLLRAAIFGVMLILILIGLVAKR